jgi:proteic killer suppression protein
VQIESIKHKRLKGLVTKGDRRIMEPDRLTDMIAFINAAVTFDHLSIPPNFGFHPLKENRAGDYGMTVTKNWRLTFTKVDDQTISNLNLEDYHE